MKLKYLKRFLMTLTFLSGIVSAQNSVEFWITVKDGANSTDSAKLYFGNHIAATYGIDSLNSTIKEKQGPPPGPGFDARWVSIPGRVNTWGLGLITYDFRYVQYPSIDTFALKFQNMEHPEADFTFQWPDRCYLYYRCDSMVIVESSGKIPKVNMFDQSSLVIPTAGDSGINKIFIYKYGMYLEGWGDCAVSVQNNALEIPPEFSLHQNYPNPFNPATTISFDLQRRSVVSLTVYDVLGQEVSRVIENQTIDAGVHEVKFDSRIPPSGVYFYRLTTHDTESGQMISQAVKKMIILQ
jgi:hypothetical protein